MKHRPLDRFFSRFPTFDYCRSAPVNAEFARLRYHEGWKPRGDKSKEMYGEFRNALISEFNATYGMDANSIKSWQYLCTLLRIDPIPCCLEECREVCDCRPSLCSNHNTENFLRLSFRPMLIWLICWILIERDSKSRYLKQRKNSSNTPLRPVSSSHSRGRGRAAFYSTSCDISCDES